MPLHKSHSERLGLRKSRQPWQRSSSHPVDLQTPKSKPLLPVSEVTKDKLSRFQYHPGEADSTRQDAGQTSPWTANDDTSAGQTRLNWRDLMDPGVAAEDDTDTSPSDKVLWNNKQDSLYVSALSPMLARKRKRARSSSPISSPLADKPEPPTVDVGMLREALKLGHADPTMELWDRYSYSLNGPENAKSSPGVVKPALDQLMISSSPKPRGDDSALKTDFGLRRAMMCGLSWPKRRKNSKTERVRVSDEHQELGSLTKKPSLVTELLDTVDQGLEEACVQPEQDESPSLNKRRLPPNPHSSPCRAVAGGGVVADLPCSDYGDDDFDDDTLTELEASLIAGDGTKALSNTNQGMNEASTANDDDIELVDDGSSNLDQQVTRGSDAPKTPPGRPQNKGAQKSPGDEFEDDFDADIDFDAVELAATQTVQQRRDVPPATKTEPKAKVIQRYLVTSVVEGDYIDELGHTRPEKMLIIQADGSKAARTVHLRGAWFDTPAHTESYVHVIGKFSAKGQCFVDDAQNLLILHPDQLLSATVVADSFGCMRRAVLQDRVKATSEATPPLVYGTILHEIFQEALLANSWDLAFLSGVINRKVEEHVEDLYRIRIGIAAATEHLLSKMTELSYWAKAFVSAAPKTDAVVEDRNGKTAAMAVRKLLDVEEHVWSPMYGLKGNIDATVEVVMADGKEKRTLTVPFELKTGRQANSSHMAQTALYTLLLADRYDIDIAYGILYYMETSKTMRIPAVRHELRHMIMQRNQLACHIRERSVKLPPMLKNKHVCGRCYAKTSCFIYHRLADEGDAESSGMKDKFDELVRHLTPAHRDFFVRWENLLTKEEKESQKTKRELWTMTSSEREKKSRCFADVIIEQGSGSETASSGRINRFHYTFVKRLPQPKFSFLESELSTGEPVVVSDEEGHFALAIGYVTSVRKQRISVAVDRRLHNARIRQPGFDDKYNQVFASIMEVQPEAREEVPVQSQPLRYRLDKDEFSNGMATVRNNLVQMMANDVPAAVKMRRLLVDLEAPRFKETSTQYGVAQGSTLNVDQERAIDKVMRAQDYALVLGMPGTGKTTTIAHIIRALTSQGKSVLLTSHTHTAVDNILLKLEADDIPVLRLGAPAKIHAQVQGFARLAATTRKTFDDIRDAWHGTPVVATTCLGINHALFLERSFDYCIVDEASQITLPICAGPIRMASAFVLVGDHNQLPPVVRNSEARQGGLDVSLFKLLSDAHPESVVNLEHQYRMCEDIMTLSNTLIYDGRLRCGYEALRRRKLDVPALGALRNFHHGPASLLKRPTPRSFCTGPTPSRCWLYHLIEGEARVRFVNTDTIRPAVHEEAQGKRIVNRTEVRIVGQLVDALLATGVAAEEVGVMTHYRAQLGLLHHRLRRHSGVEMHTTDRFQGRDKDVMVVSLVRCNEARNIGDLLRDWRRINVAFTRARAKLLVIGSKSTLQQADNGMLGRFVALMESRDWVYDLPADAVEAHVFDDEAWSDQSSPSSPPPVEVAETGKKPSSSASADKENRRRGSPKKARVGARALLRGKPVLRDILADMMNGAEMR
ncbi:DNA replication factor Dna2 [Ophiocordyceps camponoti-floridani]|uniref:DNA replication ATP-dependent helicase/nuclease n=1 Tax=Ophiocordyceps camponoti-floridani TaxID=2030778 RepID=A0A8H4QE35_9HYPO|nr:DNA replication factor Dna2 [Ophiocordyceps camponoti-floridani]